MSGASSGAGPILGCVLAGGESQRFGSDKAMALFDGQTLLSRAVAFLECHCAAVVVAGRGSDARSVADWPERGLGPLAGLAGALRHARDRGFVAVLAIGVDSVGLPVNLPGLLSPAPACLAAQPVVGLWPVTSLPAIEEMLTDEGLTDGSLTDRGLTGGRRRSMLGFAEKTGARLVELAEPPANINTPDDLARLSADANKSR